MVEGRRLLPGLRAQLHGLGRRRDRRPAGDPQPPGLPGAARRRCAVAQPHLPLPDGRQRLRHHRPPRRRPGVGRPRRRGRPDRGRARARHPGHRRSRAQPHLGPAPVVPRGAGVTDRQPGAGPLPLPAGPGQRRRRAAQRLAQRVRRLGVDPRAGGGRGPRRVVPAPVLPRPAGPELDEPRGMGGPGQDTAVLAGPRRRRVPHRRRARDVQEAGRRGGARLHRRRPAVRPGRRARRAPDDPRDPRPLPGAGGHRRARGAQRRPVRALRAVGRAAPGGRHPAGREPLRRGRGARRDRGLPGGGGLRGGRGVVVAVRPRPVPPRVPVRRGPGRAGAGAGDGPGAARAARRGVHLQRRRAGAARRGPARRGPPRRRLAPRRRRPRRLPRPAALGGGPACLRVHHRRARGCRYPRATPP